MLHLPDHRAVEHFLGPLPIRALHSIGPAQAAQLQRYGLHTIGALAAMDETVVCRILGGKAGRALRARARGTILEPALAVLGLLGGAPVLPGLPSRSSSRCAAPACACVGVACVLRAPCQSWWWNFTVWGRR